MQIAVGAASAATTTRVLIRNMAQDGQGHREPVLARVARVSCAWWVRLARVARRGAQRRRVAESETLTDACGSRTGVWAGETENETVTSDVRTASTVLSGVGSGVVESCPP